MVVFGRGLGFAFETRDRLPPPLIDTAYGLPTVVGNRMKRDLAIRALEMTIALRQHGFKVSMSSKGNCYPSHGLFHKPLSGNAWLSKQKPLK